MPKVIVFHYADKGKPPKLSEAELSGVVKKPNEILKDYPDVKYNGTYVNDEGRGICDWEAPNAEVVSEIVKKLLGEPPADGAMVVKRLGG